MNQVTISRIVPGVSGPGEILLNRSSLNDFSVTVDGKHLGVLYVKRSYVHPPPWLAFFQGNVEIDIPMITASSSAVLLTRNGTTLFALPFGHGDSLINSAVEDSQFGLKATLNAVDPSQLRAIDHRRLESNPRHVREQISKAADLDQFNIVNRDVYAGDERALAGTPAFLIDDSLQMGSRPVDELTQLVEAAARGRN